MRFLLLLLVHCATSATAHFCLVSPKQRGELALGEAGEDVCYRRTPYCGGAEPGLPTATFTAGAMASITFQQNLNHWYQPNPGYMDVAIASGNNPSDDAFTVLHTIPDFWGVEMVQQNNFTVQVRMPAEASPHSVVRVRYVSNAPTEMDPPNNTHSIFYNCADVRLVTVAETLESLPPISHSSSPSEKTGSEIDALDVNERSVMDCEAPERFEAEFEEHTGTGIVYHRVDWDAPNMRTRWQMHGHLHSSMLTENFTMFSDYNLTRNPRQNEFQIRDDGFCYRYGHGFFYHWEFGSARHMRFIGSKTNGIRTWVSGDATIGKMFHATVRADGKCIPAGWDHKIVQSDGTAQINTATMMSFNEVREFDETIFVPPTLKSAKKDHRDCDPAPGMARIGCGHGPKPTTDVVV